MRRFLIASKKYSGQVEVLYVADLLQRIDFAGAELTAQQRVAFKAMLPVEFAAFEPAMVVAGATVVEEAYRVSFDDYWKLVKKKVNRKRCEQVWGKMNQVDQVLAVNALPKYYKYLQKNNRMEADPETYLKNAYYETQWDKV